MSEGTIGRIHAVRALWIINSIYTYCWWRKIFPRNFFIDIDLLFHDHSAKLHLVLLEIGSFRSTSKIFYNRECFTWWITLYESCFEWIFVAETLGHLSVAKWTKSDWLPHCSTASCASLGPTDLSVCPHALFNVKVRPRNTSNFKVLFLPSV